MNKLDYIFYSFRNKAFLYKNWAIDLFGLPKLPEKPNGGNFEPTQGLPGEPKRFNFEDYPGQLFQEGGAVTFFNSQTMQWDIIEGLKAGTVLYRWKEVVELKAGALVNLTQDVKTFLGNVIVNQIVLCYPFGSAIPFQTGVFSVGKIEKIIADKLEAVPDEPDAVRDPNKIYTDQLEHLYYPAVSAITGWAQFTAPAATPYTIVTAPDIKSLRLKLLKENADSLDDPATIARIMKQLIDHDKAFQDKDPEKGFLKPGKDFDVVRAKQFLMHGIEYDFSDKSKITVVERSLSEGWDITKLPEMTNSLIDGTFSRGALTALGGEAAKFLGRFFLNNVITIEDCGSTLGVYHLIEGDIHRNFLGMYWMNDEGVSTMMTEEFLEANRGKTLRLRSSMFCHVPDGNFCVHCMGQRFENSRSSLGSLAIEVGNRMMSISLSAFHGKALKVKRWDWKKDLI